MTPTELLQAAIDKLEQQRAAVASVSLAYQRWVRSFEVVTLGEIVVGSLDGQIIAQAANGSIADLIVTLHRTIDAQLAILRNGIGRIGAWVDPDSQVGWEPQDGPVPPDAYSTYLALADAILGGES